MKPRAMISQPMNGKTNEQIIGERKEAVRWLERAGYEIVDTVFNQTMALPNEVVNKSVAFLNKSIEAMSICHAVYFCKGWENARGCKIEHDIASAYGLAVFYEGSFKLNRTLDLILWGLQTAEKGGRKVNTIHIGKHALLELRFEIEEDLVYLAINESGKELNKIFGKELILIDDPEQTNDIFVVLEGKGKDSFYLQKDMNMRFKA
jgi:hypothetical protein